MTRFIVFLFAISFIHFLVPDFLMSQEALEKEGMPLYFFEGRKIQSFALQDKGLLADSFPEEWNRNRNNTAALGYVTKGHGFGISLMAYRDDTFKQKPKGFFESVDESMESSIDKNVFLSGDITFTPSYGFSLSAYYDSESEYFDGNNTTGMTIRYETGRTTLNAKYIGAIQQEEDHYLDNFRYKEHVWFGTLAYKLRENLKLAIRYEAFHDEISGEQDKILDERVSVGGKLTLFERGPFNTNLMAEYRKSTFEKKAIDSASPHKGEFLTRLAIEF